MTASLETPMRLTYEDACAASEWGFNCGPAAICAILNMTPNELRPHLGDFERKRYTNPTLMYTILKGIGVCWRTVYRGDDRNANYSLPHHGLVRVQWSGPWTEPGVPIPARYRKTHWIAVRDSEATSYHEVFDVNAMKATGGWLLFDEWESSLVPWILKRCVPKADGAWWPTHCLEILK